MRDSSNGHTADNRLILIIEDEELVRNYISQLLVKAGWNTVAVGSAHEAVAELGQTAFRAVICLDRPHTGLELIKKRPARNRQTPFVFLTGRGNVDRCRAAFLYGAHNFLEKPCQPQTILDAIEQATRRFNVGAHDSSAALTHVHQALQIIDERYADYLLSVAGLAEGAKLTPEHFSRLFKDQVGRNPLEYIHHVRVGKSLPLLKDPTKSIYEIAVDCGFLNSTVFGIWFRRLHGVTPTAWRRNEVRRDKDQISNT